MRKLIDWFKSLFVCDELRVVNVQEDVDGWGRYEQYFGNTTPPACGCCAQSSSISAPCSCLCHERCQDQLSEYFENLRMTEMEVTETRPVSAYMLENCCQHYQALQEECPIHPRENKSANPIDSPQKLT